MKTRTLQQLREAAGDRRVLIALDGMSLAKAKSTAFTLSPDAAGVKANDFLHAYGASAMNSLPAMIRFADPKLNDIGNTVGNCLARYEGCADLVTVHASISFSALKTAVKTADAIGVTAVFVTVLTDFDDVCCRAIYGAQTEEKIRQLVTRAAAAGAKAFVCSAHEVTMVRRLVPHGLIITPGVRSDTAVVNDQKRIGTPYQAIKDGADFLVVGRQVLNRDGVDNQVAELRRINDEVTQALHDRVRMTT